MASATATTQARVRPPKPGLLADLEVLVIGINYAPEVTGIAPYTTAMAEDFASCGSHVSVVAGVPHYPSWTVGEPYRWRLRTRQRVNGVEVLRLRHHVPAKQSATRRALYEGTFLAQALAAAPQASPDVVLAVVPSLGSGVCGARLARKYGVPLVVVLQDLLGQAARQSGIAGGSRVARATAALEARVLRQATRHRGGERKLPSGAGRIRGGAGTAWLSLPNWSHVVVGVGGCLGRCDAAWDGRNGVSIALHSGNMGLKQDLGNVLEAARLTSGRTELLFVLMGDGSQRRALCRRRPTGPR